MTTPAEIMNKIGLLKDHIRSEAAQGLHGSADEAKQLAEVWCSGLDLLGGFLIDVKTIADAAGALAVLKGARL